ncbi:hypothetical protein TruAng_009464 [Truncatella angustata]|nr:hypothetical protein TruAng_009464 [Truncatella angustata]
MRARKLVSLPMKLPLKLLHKLAPHLRRSRIDGAAVNPPSIRFEMLDEKATLRKDSPPPLEECPICQDPVGVPNPEGTVESWTSLHCSHKFGTICIQTWLQDSLDRDDPHNPNPTCPICRDVAKHPSCGHPVCIVPTFEMQWNAWQQYHTAAMADATFVNFSRPPVRQRNRLQRREGHPSRPSFTPPKRKADTVGECSVCAEASKKKEMEKRILSFVQPQQETQSEFQEELEMGMPSITRKSAVLHMRRGHMSRRNGEPSRASTNTSPSPSPSPTDDEELHIHRVVCNTPPPRIPTPVPMGASGSSLLVGTRRVSTAF